jgi:hypothetical protein
MTPDEKMPYRISYIDTSNDEQLTERSSRMEEFPTEPAALARARELLEDTSCKMVLISRDAGGDKEEDNATDNRRSTRYAAL